MISSLDEISFATLELTSNIRLQFLQWVGTMLVSQCRKKAFGQKKISVQSRICWGWFWLMFYHSTWCILKGRPTFMHTKPFSTRRTRRSFETFRKFEELIEGCLGLMPGEPYSLKRNAESAHASTFTVSQKHLKIMKDEVNRLIELGVLRQANDSEWSAPSFGIPKKDNTIHFVSDFTGLSKHVVRHPFLLPSIQETILTMIKFTYCTTLDMNMVTGLFPCVLSRRESVLLSYNGVNFHICAFLWDWLHHQMFSMKRCPSCSMI